MDQEILVKQIQKVAKRLRAREGPVALLMLLAPDIESEDAWNLIVSAKGLDRRSRGAAVKEFTHWLREDVDQSQWPRIARATVLRTDDPFVKAINKAFRARGSAMNLQSCNVFGVEIPKAILIESNKVAA
jgi:hypothetical protein